MEFELKDLSVAVYEVYIVTVIRVRAFFLFLPSSCRVVSKMSISVHKI